MRGGKCGCLDAEDNEIDLAVGEVETDRFVAVNVKLFLSERDGSVIHSSPEFRHDPHMTVVIKLREKQEDKSIGIGCTVMLNPPEVETEAQARKDGRLVDLEGMARMMQFSGVLGDLKEEEESENTAAGDPLVDKEG